MHTTSWQRRWTRATAAARTLALAASVWPVAAVLLIAPLEAAAQQFTAHHYQQAEGFGNLSVSCLLQDRAGFIWICTEAGLYRHDGAGFDRYGPSEGIDTSAIRSALEDSSGALWIGTSQDLYRRDQQGFRAVRPEGHSLVVAEESGIAALPSGELLVAREGELLVLSGPGPDATWHSRPFFTQAQLGTTPVLDHIGSVYVDRLGRIWLGCGAAVCKVEHERVDVFDANSGTPDDEWRSWLLDRDGRLWARGQAHMAVLDVGAAGFEIRDPPHARLAGESQSALLIEDPQGRVLTATGGGLSRLQGDTWQEFSKANGIPNGGISALLVSRDGQLWLGLRGHGLVRWLGYGHIESWTMAQGLGDLRVASIVRGPDRGLLMATRAGCYRLELAARITAPCQIGNLPRGDIKAMAEGGGALWIGMSTGALFRVATGDSRATWIADVPSMRKLFVDSTERLWISTDNGVDTLAPGAMHLEPLLLPVQAGEVADVAEDGHGAIWLATQGGLLRWADGRWTVLGIDGEHARSGFLTIAADQAGWLWAGSTSRGMLHLHVVGDSADTVQWVSDLMVARSAARFTSIDRRGWIWDGTDSGVLVFDGRAWRRLSVEDGLIWNDAVENGFLADSDGSVWIGTRGGLTHIQDPEALVRGTPIDLRITRSVVENMALSLHLSQFTFGSANGSFLRVRLRGQSDEWVSTRSHDLHYAALAPGQYTFEAFAVDPNRQQTSPLTRLSFEILPPWWETSWFRLATAAALIALLGVCWRWRARRLEAHAQELERRKAEHDELVVRATRDALTGLWNRNSILEILARETKAARKAATPLAVALIDIDHFKHINDSRGHLAGDEVLRTLGAKLSGRIRATDSLGRYGGEEFLLIVPGAPMQTPFLPLERLQRAIADITFSYAGSDFKVTASFGVAWLSGASDSAEILLGRADAALYSAKHAGRNRVEYAATA
jgi:diguanylate cyclase (GGDEF)-like protein